MSLWALGGRDERFLKKNGKQLIIHREDNQHNNRQQQKTLVPSPAQKRMSESVNNCIVLYSVCFHHPVHVPYFDMQIFMMNYNAK